MRVFRARLARGWQTPPRHGPWHIVVDTGVWSHHRALCGVSVYSASGRRRRAPMDADVDGKRCATCERRWADHNPGAL